MKTFLLLVLLPLAFTGCLKKNDDPAPDAGTLAAGSYQLSRVASFVNDQPVYDFAFPQTDGMNTRTGTLILERRSETSVYVSVVQQVNGKVGTPTTFGKMDLKATGSGYALSQYNQSNQQTGSGTLNGSAITITLSDTYPATMEVTRYVLEARR